MRILAVVLAVLCLGACAHHRQVRVHCSGHLERINAQAPAQSPTAPATERDAEKQP